MLERVSLGAFQRVRPRARLRLHDTRVVVVVVVVHQSRRSLPVPRPPPGRFARRSGGSVPVTHHPPQTRRRDRRRPPSRVSPLRRFASLARAASRSCRTTRRRPPETPRPRLARRRRRPARAAAPRALGESFPHLQGDALGPHGGRAQAPDGAPRPRTDERHRGHPGDGPGVRHARSRRTGHQTHAPTVDATPPRRAPRIARPQAPIRGAIRRRVDGWTPSPETETLPPTFCASRRRGGGQNRAHVSGPGRATPSVGRHAPRA